MSDILMMIAALYIAFWFGGVIEKADLSTQCFKKGVITLDGTEFQCSQVKKIKGIVL